MSSQDSSVLDVIHPFSGAFSMPQSERPKLFKEGITPGVGKYDVSPKPQNKGVRWSQVNKDNVFPVKKLPGVGDYNIPLTEIGKKGMTMVVTPFPQEKPITKAGPGSYDLVMQVIKKQDPAFSMGNRQDTDLSHLTYLQTPGPGYYYDQIEKFKNHTVQSKNQIGLGFGDKDSIYKIEARKNPGPGRYSSFDEDSSQKRIGFPKGDREPRDIKEVRDHPGIGSYTLDRSFIKSMSSVTLKPRIPILNNRDLTPGPGQYDPKSLSKNPAIKIGLSQRQKLNNSDPDNPAPGQYDISSSSKYYGVDPDRIFNGFGSAPRNTLEIQNIYNPGPADYTKPDFVGKGTSIAIPKAKYDALGTFKHKLPGVGEYNLDKSSFDNSKGIKMKIKTEISDTRKDFPGVGLYTVQEQKVARKSPQFSFGIKHKDPIEIFQTSPFSYNIQSGFGHLPSYMKKGKKFQPKIQPKQTPDQTNQ